MTQHIQYEHKDLTNNYKYSNNYCNLNSDSCYLTTTMCNILGYSDDCYYLKVIKDFKNNYLMKKDKYFNLLAEYEVIGPIISRCIRDDKETATMMLDYVIKIVKYINNNNYNNAINTYIAMISNLKRKYNLDNLNINASNVQYRDEQNKHNVRILIKK